MNKSWLRWTVPPGVSLAVHALLISLIAYIGMQISAEGAPKERLAVAELALPAPPSVPDQGDERSDPNQRPDQNTPGASRPSATQLPDLVQSQVESLEQRQAAASPRMDPVTADAIRRTNEVIARPESAAQPSVRFAGVQSKAARTLVYVVDGSGATANSFAYLQTQLMRSIDRLSPTQRFQVVLFREADDSQYTLAPINNGGLARATPEHKRAVADWLDTIAARGRSNPLEGLKVALGMHPDLVLLITRSIQRTEMGWAQGQREILATLNELNPANARTGQRATVIKAVQLLDEDPTGIMRAIGGLHGDGNDDYKVIAYDDLVAAEEPESIAQRSIGASDEQRIASAAQMWGELIQSGTAQSLLTSVGDAQQLEQANQIARGVLALIAPLRDSDGRAELLWAQATLLLHHAQPGFVNDRQLRAIIDRLGSVMYTDPITDAQRVMIVALTHGQLDEAQIRIALLDELVMLSDDLGLDELTRAQALLGLIALGEEPDSLSQLAAQTPFITRNGSIDALWGLLLREGVTITRLRHERAGAWAPLLSIRRAAAGNDAIVNYIDQRIALIYATHGRDSAPTPSRVLMAAGLSMARSIHTREDALRLFERVAQTQEDDAPNAQNLPADALWEIGVLGRAINAEWSIERSNSALTELAQRFPTDPRALGAISSAIGASNADSSDVLRKRLEIAIELFPQSPAIDLWRLRLGEFAEGFARLDILDRVTPDTREGVLAGELYEQTVLGMLDQYNDPQTRSGLGLRMRDAALRFGLGSAEMWTKRAAMSEAAHDPQRGLASIDQLIEQAQRANRPTQELLLLRAQTLLRMDQIQTAFSTLRELSIEIDASGRRTSTYWQSWTLMLEAIAQRGSESERIDALRHYARLQLIDPDLGGSPWRERLQDVQETLHSDP